jgi:hypothetical protein
MERNFQQFLFFLLLLLLLQSFQQINFGPATLMAYVIFVITVVTKPFFPALLHLIRGNPFDGQIGAFYHIILERYIAVGVREVEAYISGGCGKNGV